MRNNRLLPYEIIVQATSGEPEAVNTVLQYYSRRIRYAALVNGQADKDVAKISSTVYILTPVINRNLSDHP